MKKEENLEITLERAVVAYEKGTPKEKLLLENLFGKHHFIKNIMERCKSWSDICLIAGIDANYLPFANNGTAFNKRQNGLYQWAIIASVLNEGWSPNWEDENEYKYYIWMKFEKGRGFVFCSSGDCRWISSVSTGLLFKSSELAKYCATQFEDIINKALI